MVVLHKVMIDPGGGQCLSIPAFAKKAACVPVAGWGQDQYARQGRFFYLHHIPVLKIDLLAKDSAGLALALSALPRVVL